MDAQKLYDNIGTLCTIIAAAPMIKSLLNSKPVLVFLEDLRVKFSPLAFKIEENIKKHKAFINFILRTIGIGSFALCIAGATCAYILGAKIEAVLIFITLGLVLRWFYGKLLIIS